VGAGPAGSSAALTLKNSGLKVALVDKAHFPRHKTCGDAIPGPTLKALRQIIPDFDNELQQLEMKQHIKYCHIVAPNNKTINIHWQAEAYNSPRKDFDGFLFSQVKKNTDTEIFEGFEVAEVTKENTIWQLKERNSNRVLQGRLLIGCGGANSIITKHVAHHELNRERHCTAVAAYYTGINSNALTNKFYLFKNYLPGYFWVFPLGDDTFNVGFGIVSSEAAKHNIKLREVMDDIIANEPAVAPLFVNARPTSDVKGFGLPIGGKEISISGEGYMLAGDAAALIDPLQGHGIDKAAYSGILAAQKAKLCFEQNNFTADFIKLYDQKVYAKYGAELRRNYQLMRMLNKQTWILNIAARFAAIPFVKKAVLKRF
jgi:menaquinone-9 beta-reductase